MVKRALAIVVAGTGFGRIYLDALAKGDPAFRLSGILARGGDRSRACAARCGVPLYTDPDAVPDDTDIVCVVVRSGAIGGPGTELARSFLHRGIHVLQEHPVHHDEIARCLQAARGGNAAYAVNTLHPNLTPVRRFLAAAAALREHHPPRYLDVTSNSQMLYPLLDIAGRAAGDLRPWTFSEPSGHATGHPFGTLHGFLHDVPLCLRVQNAVHPEDPDNHSMLLGQIAIGFDGGILALPELHGPVLWHARLHAARSPDGSLRTGGPGTDRLASPSTSIVGPATSPSWHEVFADTWPNAVLAALRELAEVIEAPARRRAIGRWALDVSQAWNGVSRRFGIPAILRPEEPPVVPVDMLHAAIARFDAREEPQP